MENPWKDYQINDAQTRYWKIGHTGFWIKNVDKGWEHCSKSIHDHDTPVSGINGQKPDDLEWSTYYVRNSTTIRVRPVLPEKPVVLKPPCSYKILPGQQTIIFVKIPVWIRIYDLKKDKETLMVEIPSQSLSNTWMGDTDDGELSYMLPGTFFDKPDHESTDYSEAFCMLTVNNSSDKLLDFERLSIRVEHLDIYLAEHFLVTGDLEVNYRGAEQITHLNFSGKTPKAYGKVKKISDARIPNATSLVKRSFYFIRSVTQL